MSDQIKRQNSIYTSATLASTRINKIEDKRQFKNSAQNLFLGKNNLLPIQNKHIKLKYQNSHTIICNKPNISKRYNTAEGQINRIKNKKISKPISNQIYFPHNVKSFSQEKILQQPDSNNICDYESRKKIKSKEIQIKSNQKNKKCFHIDFEQNFDSNGTYLKKLNQEKQIKIKQIYMPKGLNSFHIDVKKHTISKSMQKSRSDVQNKKIKLFSFSQAKNKIQKSQNLKSHSFNNLILKEKRPFQKQKSEESHSFSKSLNLKQQNAKIEQQRTSKSIKNSIQFKIGNKQSVTQILSKEQRPLQKLPKYTEFYDSFLTQIQIKPVCSQQEKKYSKQKSTFNYRFAPYHIPTPSISQIRNSSLVPHQLECQKTIYFPDNIQKQWVCQKFNPHLQLLKNLSDLSDFVIKKVNQGVYFGQVQEQKMHGLGVIFQKSGTLFQGNFVNDEKSGQGYQLYPDGSFFLGNYQGNKKNGKGRFQWNNGQIYDGEWRNEKKHGSGLWKAKNISYAGQWKNNSIQGFGVLIEQNERYQGEFHNFFKHGHGIYRYANGQIYNGTFKMNRLNGLGQYYWPNGDFYKGNFINNKRHGKGILKLAEKVIYNGQFRNDKKCGLGQQAYENGLIYRGNFQNDLKHGWGTLLIKDRPIYSGYFVNNKTLQVSQTPSNNQVIDQEEQFLKNNMSDKVLTNLPNPQLQNKKNQKSEHQKGQNEIKKLRSKHLKNNYYMKRIVETEQNLSKGKQKSISKQKSLDNKNSKFRRAFKFMLHK